MKKPLHPAEGPIQVLKTKDQIAKEMGIHVRTLHRHLKKAGMMVPRGLIYPAQQEEIYKKLGWNR